MSQYLGFGAGTLYNLASFSGLEFNIINGVADGNISKHHSISLLKWRFRRSKNLTTNLDIAWSKKIAPFTIPVNNFHDKSASVRVVFQGFHFSRDSSFIELLKIN